MDPLAWQAAGPGRWERDLDEAEQFYTSLAKAYEGCGRTFFAMTGFISLAVAVPGDTSRQAMEHRVIDALRRAWVALRYDHPTIAARVEYDKDRVKCTKVYETFLDGSRGPQLQAWLDDTFRTVFSGQTGLEWCNSDPPVPRLPTLFLITSPSSEDRGAEVRWDLVLRSHHDILDGIGTLHLFNNLFSHAARAYAQGPSYQLPTFGSEWKNLSPSLREAAGIARTPTPEQRARFDGIVAHNAALGNSAELVSVPFKRGAAMPGRHQRVSRTLSADRSSLRLLQACRDLGVTVTHAYHAAIAMCVRDLQERREQERSVRYINYCLMNLRSHCKEPFNTPKHAAAVYHSTSGRSLVIDLAVPAATEAHGAEEEALRRKEEFRKTVSEVKDFYHAIRNDPEHIPMVPLYWTLAIPPYPEDGSTPPVPGPNPSPSVSISSMGVIDSIISPTNGPFELANPWVAGEELGTGLGLFLGTWRGQLSLSAAYNDAYHDKAGVLKFLKDCEDEVFQGLGI
ncbi:hypothetical protein UCRNP2_9248 [Neofusicoccum parvum UCRNP2]|uniref:Uncharacterized protein n=1 Tax=Botryosphaeria parva (strain UCR-NP2) TaxID=1287680 RepID=R1GDP7_BOTPV|nr:hypothetical protein UCRNP2_9248 [Neofusicoccum parvum UCRNP2]